MGILSTIVFASVAHIRNKAYLVRARAETKNIHTAVEFYLDDYGDYPADVSRDLPSGLEEYISSGIWTAPWPGSVYDWDNWTDPETGGLIIQISIRFCQQGLPDTCKFPNEDWAADFGVDSSVYYCIEGSCRSHIGQDIDYPGYCLNCASP